MVKEAGNALDEANYEIKKCSAASEKAEKDYNANIASVKNNTAIRTNLLGNINRIEAIVSAKKEEVHQKKLIIERRPKTLPM